MTGKYGVIVCDPPWWYEGSGTKWGAAAKEYPLMTDDEIFALPIREQLADNGILFLWTTSPKLAVAVEAISRWELHYKSIGFVWVKTKQDGTPIRAQGVRPSIVKPLTELVLCASPVKRGRPRKLASESICQTVFAPKREHSQKPEDVQDRIEAMYPDSEKLELFARRERPGWDCLGLEVGAGVRL